MLPSFAGVSRVVADCVAFFILSWLFDAHAEADSLSPGSVRCHLTVVTVLPSFLWCLGLRRFQVQEMVVARHSLCSFAPLDRMRFSPSWFAN